MELHQNTERRLKEDVTVCDTNQDWPPEQTEAALTVTI